MKHFFFRMRSTAYWCAGSCYEASYSGEDASMSVHAVQDEREQACLGCSASKKRGGRSRLSSSFACASGSNLAKAQAVFAAAIKAPVCSRSLQ